MADNNGTENRQEKHQAEAEAQGSGAERGDMSWTLSPRTGLQEPAPFLGHHTWVHAQVHAFGLLIHKTAKQSLGFLQ